MIAHHKAGPRMSQAVTHNGVVTIAGQVADDRKADIEGQTRDALADPDLRVEMTAIAAL